MVARDRELTAALSGGYRKYSCTGNEIGGAGCVGEEGKVGRGELLEGVQERNSAVFWFSIVRVA